MDSQTSDETRGDDALVARAQQGDVSAFDTLVRRHLPRATVLARSLLRNTADAEDLVQDAFLRAFDRLHTLDVTRGGFGAWLSRIVVNTGLNAIESRRRRQTEPAHLARDLPSGDVPPDEAAERSEFRRRFTLALDALSERQRVIVTLYEVEGSPTQEIADALGMQPETVRWHLHKARHLLRAALGDFRDRTGEPQ